MSTPNRSYEQFVKLVERLGFARCDTIHGSYPPGFTCLDTQRYAREHPEKYAPVFLEALLAGKHLCDRCQVRVAINELRGK